MTRCRFLAAAVLAISTLHAAAAEAQTTPRLYALDCGHASFKDFGAASDTGDFDGRAAELADPCFLIQHPKGWLLWDAGLPAALPASVTGGLSPQAMADQLGFRTWLDRPVTDQLRDIGITPDDVGWLAFSHLHFDHVGQASLFQRATWIVNRDELDWALAKPAHVSMSAELLANRPPQRTKFIDGDFDVFGDGSVRILKTPGHTPGSSVLLVRLARSGPVILSGDLYLTREGREHQHVPTVNADRAATLASMHRVEAITKRLRARVIVQHSPQDFAALPKPPAFLD
ncbi:N-acyl homoserine lactonase family protein [Piscinibacter terrae]|nr:N-acyl homoserine lactonase family protein [Albitalea terrae]